MKPRAGGTDCGLRPCIWHCREVAELFVGKFETARDAHHGGVVGGERKRRYKRFPAVKSLRFLHFAAQERIGRHAPRDGHLFDTRLTGGLHEFIHQASDNGLLHACTKVVLVFLDKVGVFLELVAHQIEKGSLEPAEAVVEFVHAGTGNLETVGVALFGQTVYHWAAGVGKPHDFGGLVDAFARRIVDGAAQHLETRGAFHFQNLRVAARNQKTQEREFRCVVIFGGADEMRQHMGFQMIHLHKGNMQRERKRFGKGHPHKERTHQSGASCKGDGVEVSGFHAGGLQHGVHHGNDVLQMRP